MKKILIVEDHPGMREALRRQIQSWGFAAITARNGKEGVETALKEKADLIMIDLMMPEMDGLQMTEILRSNSETKEVPIIAVTAAFRRQDRQNCTGVGCNDYIVKPFKLEELQKKINALVQQVE
jgi:DNA-binding response OmpR family regulator